MMQPAKRSSILQHPFLPSLLVGLGLGRLVCELFLTPAPWLVAMTAVVVSGLVWYLIARSLKTVWPLVLLLVYIFWPAYAPQVGVAVVGGTALALWLTISQDEISDWLLGILVFCGSMLLYLLTLSPGLLPADSGEFQLVTNVLGIAHPPGYALYTMLGKLFSLLPLADHTIEMNLLSAVFSSAALVVIALAVYRVTKSAFAGVVSAGVLGLGATFWVQSTTTNIRSLSALFTVLLVALLLGWQRNKRDAYLAWLGLVFGLAVGHHASLAFLALPITAFLFCADTSLIKQPRRWLGPLGLFAASFVVLLYLPIRSAMSPAFDTSHIDSVSAFFSHVFATGFGGDMFYYRTLPEIIERLGIWWQIMGLELGTVLSLIALGGLGLLIWRDWRKAVLLGGMALINSLVAITYKAPQTVEYMLPTYVAAAFIIGLGYAPCHVADSPSFAGRKWWRAVSSVALAGLAMAVMALGASNWPDLDALHKDDSTREYAESILNEAPEDALILAGWHQVTPLWYLQIAEGQRPDVTIDYVYPEGDQDNETVWLKRINAGLEQGPVVVTNWFYAYEQSGLTFTPLTEGWLVSEGATAIVPDATVSLDVSYAEGLSLLGYELSSNSAQPGETITLSLYWQVNEAVERDYTLFAQLIGPQGVIGQGDHAQQTTSYTVGGVRVDSFDMPLLLQTIPGEYNLVCGFYYADGEGWTRLLADGADTVSLGSVQVQAASQTPETVNPLAIQYAEGTLLKGYDVDNSIAGQTRLYLHWMQPEGLMAASALVSILNGQELIAQATLPALTAGQTQTLALDLPSGLRSVSLVLETDGERLSYTGLWGIMQRDLLTLSLGDGTSRYVPLGGEIVYLGMASELDTDQVVLTSTLLSLRPLMNDYSVSVGLRSADGSELKDDGTPGLGSIPTLKWLGGWQVDDPHTIELAQGEAVEGWQRTLTVYDAFTLESLAVLDDRLVNAGQGLTLVDGTLASE